MALGPLRNPRAITPSFAWVLPTRSMVVRQGWPVLPQLDLFKVTPSGLLHAWTTQASLRRPHPRP